ncbi:MAG: hypothetical protein ACFFBP_03805 [Promethearchaeota archaeon]
MTNKIKKIVEDLGIDAFESNVKIAGIAVVSDSGNLVYQTENFDLKNQMDEVMNVIKGGSSLTLSNSEFIVVVSSSEGVIATNDKGMGHIIFAPFQGGILVSYAMPNADPSKVLTFLKNNVNKLNGKL